MPLCSCLGQAVLAERVRDLQRERHEARKHPPLYRRGEEEQQPGPGAVAHHRLPRQGTPAELQRCIFFSLLSHFQSERTKAEYTIGDRTVFLNHSFLYMLYIFSLPHQTSRTLGTSQTYRLDDLSFVLNLQSALYARLLYTTLWIYFKPVSINSSSCVSLKMKVQVWQDVFTLRCHLGLKITL